MRNRNRLLGAALTAIVLASIGCGDVGADNADADAAITGGRGGGAGTSAGGSGGSQAGRGGTAGSAGGSSDVSSESRTDVQVDARVDTSVDISVDISSDARLDVSGDARSDLNSDGAGGAGGGDATDTGSAGKSGAAGAGTAGAAGASGAGGSGGGAMDAGDAGGATGIDASEDTSDGAVVDAGGGPDAPTVINEGGRDAPTTTTEAILGAAAADCLACAQNAGTLDPTCDLTLLACETFTDLAQRLNCLDTLACVLPAGSAVSCVKMPEVNLTACYCGTVPTPDCLAGSVDSGVYHACKGYIDVGFPGQSQSFIGTNISNPKYSSGRAMKIAQCMGDIFNQGDLGDVRCGACF